MSEKVAVFTDCHVTPIKGMELFVDTSLKCINNILDYAENNKIKKVWFLGDFFYFKHYIESYLIGKIKPTMRRFKDFETMFIVGNHDLALKDSSMYNLMEIYEENITIVKDGGTIIEHDNANFYFVNYNDNSKIAKKEIELVDNGKKHVLLSHMDCNGFYTNANHEVKDSDISVESVEMFDIVFSGHYHRRSKIKNVQYIGNTHHMRRSDAGNPFGFMVLDLHSLNYKFQKYDNYTPPCYFEYDIGDVLKHKPKNGFVRVNVPEDVVDRISPATMANLREMLQKENHDVVFSYQKSAEVIEMRHIVDRNNYDVRKVVNIASVFENYLNDVEIVDFDRKKLLDLISNI